MRRTLPNVLLAALLSANAEAEVRLEVATVEGEPGARVSVAVQVVADAGEPVATIGNDISFDPSVLRVLPSEIGGPGCAVEPELPHFLSAFFYQPPGCEGVEVCSGIRAAVVLLRFDSPLVSGRVVYRCPVEIAADAEPGVYGLVNSEALWSTAEGVEGPVIAVDGAVVVSPAGLPTDTPTVTPQVTPRPTAAVLDPGCTGDCDASASVDAAEASALLRAVFDPEELTSCVGSEGAAEPDVKASHLLAAARARSEGCEGSLPSATASLTRTATTTATPPAGSATPTVTDPPEVDTATPTARPSRSPTRTPTFTRTRRPSVTVTRTRVRSRSPTSTPTRAVPTPTLTPEAGPAVSYLGVARADGRLIAATEEIAGAPVYEVATGAGFHLVAEGAPGPSLAPVGRTTFSISEAPDLQVLVEHNLGNGSDSVCSGGIPGFEPPIFDDSDAVVDALNDLGCRFSAAACVVFTGGTRTFVAPTSTVQFCAVVSSPIRFPRGETMVHARVRDRDGRLGDVSRMIVRVP